MRRFNLIRSEDVTGVSGTGKVAEGVEFADGTVAIRWLGPFPSTVVWASLDHAMQIHGHNGATTAEFYDEEYAAPFRHPIAEHVAELDRRHHPEEYASLAEEGRRLASEREDLIAAGADPSELLIPLHPGIDDAEVSES